MPSPKAILRDIHDHGLNPAHRHTAMNGAGRLHDPQVVIAEPVMKQEVSDHLPEVEVVVKSGLVELPKKIEVCEDQSQSENDVTQPDIEKQPTVVDVVIPDEVKAIVDDVPTVQSAEQETVVIASSKKLRNKKVTT